MPQPHFVVVTIGSAGDLFPFMRVALALREAGHRVSMLGPVQHAPFVEPSGLAFHGLPADAAVLDHPDLWHPTRGLAVVWRATRPAMAQVPAFVAALPDSERIVLLAHPLALPEADLCRARRRGLKVAALYLAPSNLPTVHDPLMLGPWPVPRWVPPGARRWLWRRLGEALINPVALPDVNAARAQQGLAPVTDLVDFIVKLPDLSVTLFPEWFAPTQPDWPQPLARTGFPLYDPSPQAVLSAQVARFLEEGPAPVVFTPGTGNRQAAHYFLCALDACARRGLRAILLTPHREQLPAHLPTPVLWQDYVPLRALLPHVAALVHHGGIGTTAEALRAGTPQLVVPLAHDQFDNAARVGRLGAGASLRAARLTAPRLAQRLAEVVGNKAVEAACRALSARCGPAELGPLCERLASLAR
ncbi:rhamnosyltransferase subunit B [Massilia varians]|uniref:Rhamnosyltransferase subunit B n=1 Tax=Massilia varians TaxID=457921 RepID=A0ABM8CAY2_9BURK|nr:glycosyltransferase [Massilia varians]BDT60400.1 rhamnosyltransferase subunit B [Massilia varians]